MTSSSFFCRQEQRGPAVIVPPGDVILEANQEGYHISVPLLYLPKYRYLMQILTSLV